MDTNSKQPLNHNKPVQRVRICRKAFKRARNILVLYPELRVRGRWLLDAGFLPGQYLRIEVYEDRLVFIRDTEAERVKRAEEAAVHAAVEELRGQERKKLPPLLDPGRNLLLYITDYMRERGTPFLSDKDPRHPQYVAPARPVPYPRNHRCIHPGRPEFRGPDGKWIFKL